MVALILSACRAACVALQHGLCAAVRQTPAMNAALSSTPPRRISAPALRRALISGARRVIADRDTLNRINVFPVADGDTGSNLAYTLNAILAGALSRPAATPGELLARVGEDAVDGARGNSGAILAQFLQGVAEAVGDAASLDQAALTGAVRRGAAAARQALSEPKEGTIISVIHAFAESLDAAAGDLGAWFTQGLERSRRALADTPRQLPVLEKAGVVDAGAKGFVDLLEGIAEFMRSRRLGAPAAEDDISADIEAHDLHAESCADPDRRWCSECLVSADAIDRLALKEAVLALGADCVVVAGSSRRVRLHAHVGQPQALFDTCARFGAVEGCKADDMLAQTRVAAAAEGVAIVTDSSADIPDGLAEALGIHVVPLRINFAERDYLDKVGLSTRDFYAKLREELLLPRTSQPPPGDFRRQFEFLLSHHPSLVYVGLSRAVSGTLQSAETAAARVDAARAQVFDTANAAGGQALLVLRAAELAAQGASAEAILDALAALRPRTLTWAVARDLSHGVRGGRVPAWARPLIEGLGMTPVARVKPEGRLGVVGALFGRRRVPERFAAYVAKRLPRASRWRLIVGHCDSAEDGQRLLDNLLARLDVAQGWLVETGPAIGAHAGPGALVVSVQPVSPTD